MQAFVKLAGQFLDAYKKKTGKDWKGKFPSELSMLQYIKRHQ